MDSIIINQKKLQRVLFRAFSECLEIDGNIVMSSHDSDKFSWYLMDAEKKTRLSPNWEIPRRSASVCQMESMNPDHIISNIRAEFVKFRLSVSQKQIPVESSI